MKAPLLAVIGICLLALFPGARAAEERNAFGEEEPGEAALMGVLYDLKQTQEHKPVGEKFVQTLLEFLSRGWDEEVLNRYYRVTKPLFTTQVFVPTINADVAPRAFGAEKLVKPSQWLVHYKGQVSPPEAGSYRFVGSADDFLAVAVNGRTVLLAPRPDMNFGALNWHPSGPDGMQAGNGALRMGDWIDLKAGEVLDLDILMGERPGGFFNCFVMIEKKGVAYPLDKDKRPILPIFQVAPYDTPAAERDKGPPFSKGAPWKSLQ